MVPSGGQFCATDSIAIDRNRGKKSNNRFIMIGLNTFVKTNICEYEYYHKYY